MNTKNILRTTLMVTASLMLILACIPNANAQAPLPPLTTYTQDFDTLANSGTSSTTPTGWVFSESGSNANTTYTAGTGSGTAGDTYSFGATASTERAFGGLQSSSLNPTIGVEFQNNTGGTVGRLVISYNCEMWRQGTVGRTDQMDFQYSTDATSLTTGTWTDFNTLDCTGTDTGSTGAKDGNTVRTAIGGTITGLSISNGSTFWLRWTDFNASGADDGLAIDDFSMDEQTTTAITLTSLQARAGGQALPLAAALLLGGMVAGLVWWRRRKS